uniref:Uncharacterized protein n=1 Tax=Candidatus Kentrum sp. MB TaxID=2138164 RepID=A0A450XVP2_9GAMM|nr:MAG: hypothetical protein BECKMB1821I_GA0114274_104410 [Candidatus Kentron sp. MB]
MIQGGTSRDVPLRPDSKTPPGKSKTEKIHNEAAFFDRIVEDLPGT